MNKLNRKTTYIVIGVVLMALVFIWDIFFPLGAADDMLYVALILLTLWFHEMRYTLVAGAVATLLIILGYYFSTSSADIITTVLTHRVLAIFSVWIAVFLISIYKRSEERAISYKEKLTTLFEHAEEGILILNSNETIRVASPKVLELLGCTEQDLIGTKISHFLSPLSINDLNNGKEAIDLHDPLSFSGKELFFLARKKNLIEFPVAVHIWSFQSMGSQDFVCFILDITERVNQQESIKRSHSELIVHSEKLEKLNEILEEKVAERTSVLSHTVVELENANKLFRQELVNKQEALAALKESQQMLETIATNFPNGITSVLNREFHYIYARGRELDNMGLSSKELIGNLFLPLRNKNVQVEIKEVLVKAFNGQTISFEYYNPELDQFFLMNGAPLPDSEHEISQVLVVSQNITALKKAEYEILRSLEKEKELNEIKSRFVSTASHEFRTPLGAILSSASLISMYSKPEDSPKRDKHVQRITSSVSHLTEILNDFLSLGKIEEGKVYHQPVEFDMIELLDDVKEEMNLVAKAGQNICVNCQVEDPKIILDKQLLRNILVNLISNAIKYSEENNVISVDALKKDGQVFFSVKDNGIGIPETDKDHLFETFYRASNVENIQGTGMGLHIVKRHIDIMNGCIDFESSLGNGSCFTVQFPL